MAKPESAYSGTVHLPRTSFPMKGDMARREPQWLAGVWERLDVYGRMLEASSGKPAFVLHDGPPYANGHLHMGHALNKVLKDMVVKSQALLGRRAPFVPGWDCHGLPIEHALLKEKKAGKRDVRDVAAFRREARAFAARFIDLQRSEFRRLGVFGDWDKPYATMSNGYEAKVIEAFRRLYRKGAIYRGLKTVSWCVTCETALAEAEVEYREKASPSVFVALDITAPASGFPFAERRAAALVWTTTPWTLPANMAVAFHPDLRYALVDLSSGRWEGPKSILLAEARVEAVLAALGARLLARRGAWTGRELVAAGLSCATPFANPLGIHSAGVLADYVSAEDGTGIVHTAPGHGLDDFNTGRRCGMKDILCPVDGAGRFTADAGEFEGLPIFQEGNARVVESLRSSGRLLGSGEITHSYPHCWRCKRPIAFRATEQWFLNVGHEGLRERLLGEVERVRWLPPSGKERIRAMISQRPDWCLSRQRLWGTPIPMLRCASCGRIVDGEGVLEAIERKASSDGSDFWYEDSGSPVTPGRWEFLPPATACPGCGGKSFLRETDILDVWMDSGASWLAALKDGEVPCQLYLEGSDQHRGWFQSSLVLSAALTGKAPYESVLTHGFILDEAGRAMHKSLGNVVSPQQVVERFGADVLRLRFALCDYTEDVRMSDHLLEGPSEAYRKIRNTFKYLLGNVCDFDPARHCVAPGRMAELDRYLLSRLAQTERAALQAYGDFSFRKAATALLDFCALELSAFYLDARKDALYTLAQDDPVRRGAQSAMYECLRRLLQLAAPVLSFTCEEAWQELRRLLREESRSSKALAESVFLEPWAPCPDSFLDADLVQRWEGVLKVRSSVLGLLEERRAAKALGSSLQARAVLSAGGDASEAALGRLSPEAWAEVLIVSDVELRRLRPEEAERLLKSAPAPGSDLVVLMDAPAEPILAQVEKAPGAKCPRCWRYRTDAGLSQEDPGLCARCVRQSTAWSRR